MQRQHSLRHWSTLGKASMIVSFKQNRTINRHFLLLSDYPNIRCDTDDFFFNCPRHWWMIWKKIYTKLRLSAALKVWSPFAVFFQSSSEKRRSCSLNSTRLICVRMGLSSFLLVPSLLISDAWVLEIAFCTGFSVSLLLGHLWFPSPCDRLVFNTALLVESKLSAHANNSSSGLGSVGMSILNAQTPVLRLSLCFFQPISFIFQDGFFHQAEITATWASSLPLNLYLYYSQLQFESFRDTLIG